MPRNLTTWGRLLRFPSGGGRATDLYHPWELNALGWFEPANLGSNGKLVLQMVLKQASRFADVSGTWRIHPRIQVKFQVLTSASMKLIAFWDKAPCSLAEVRRRFRDAYCFHHQGVLPPSPWWWRNSTLKRRFTWTRLHSATSSRLSTSHAFLIRTVEGDSFTPRPSLPSARRGQTAGLNAAMWRGHKHETSVVSP
jgi:hypothetical protein